MRAAILKNKTNCGDGRNFALPPVIITRWQYYINGGNDEFL